MKVIEYIAEVLPDGSLALPDAQKGWQIFRALGKDAVAGKLSNTSTKHDEYLYGTRK